MDATPDVPGATAGAAGAVEVAAAAGAGGGGGTGPAFFVDLPKGEGGAVFFAGATCAGCGGVSTTGTGSWITGAAGFGFGEFAGTIAGATLGANLIVSTFVICGGLA
jgi:hypothetical protein